MTGQDCLLTQHIHKMALIQKRRQAKWGLQSPTSTFYTNTNWHSVPFCTLKPYLWKSGYFSAKILMIFFSLALDATA